jgi:hypothetical protein
MAGIKNQPGTREATAAQGITEGITNFQLSFNCLSCPVLVSAVRLFAFIALKVA